MSIVKKTKYFVKGLKEKPKYIYTDKESEKFEEYVSNHIGNFDKVYHELYSPDVHIDILLIPPTDECYYYKLITKGMGAYKMEVPNIVKNNDLDRAELVIYLPPDCNPKNIVNEYGWVIRQLKTISRVPIEERSWLGFGHTFSHDDEANTKFANNVNFSGMLLVDSFGKNNEELDLRLDDKGKINFYQLIPLYKEEYLYKKVNGLNALLDKFIESDVSLVVDVNRKNLCKQINKDTIENEFEEEMTR